MNVRLVIGCAAAAVAVLAAGLYYWRLAHEHASSADSEVPRDESGRRVLYWYDPMVPGQRFDKPGKSPFMDMQLVPKYAGQGDDAGVRISPTMAQNLGIRIATVERTAIGERVTAVGRIEADERRRYALPSRVSGYVERLDVRAVGDPVSKGEKVAEIYSPDLLAAQQEYLALLGATKLSDAESLVQAARRRLALFGMAENEIQSITRHRTAQTRFGVYSPAAGFVIELNVREGAQIEAGATLMSIANLSSVWLIADVPEGLSGDLRNGAAVAATLRSAAGKAFSGQIDYIYPALDPATRTARVRISMPNEQGELRPGMLANVSLGSTAREALTVPSEALIYTGERTAVILRGKNGFRPVEVSTGAEGNGRTEVLSGVAAGDEVVASGQFLIDSEASLNGVLARLSRAGAEDTGRRAGDATSTRKAPDEVITAIGRVVSIEQAGTGVTISHGPIAELDWPAMTMAFRLADRQLARAVRPGDVVEFSLRTEQEDGEYVIVSLTKQGQP